ncbi:MAG TPA: acetate--CoA ligase family protein [Ramlibacter sp.]|nr:acetate--CoA ligase family protein [Ramlibacter sp.]
MTPAHPSGLQAIIRPRSVALIGMSSKPGSAGQIVLGNRLGGGYEGEVHLVGRSGGAIDGRPILAEVAQLPEGVELAILILPAEAVRETVSACVERGVRAAVCFASGFAEMGEAGRAQQREIAEVARAGGMALLGPNTVGYFNYVDAFHVMMVQLVLPPRLDPGAGPAVAVVAQSGGIGAHMAASLQARGVPLSYMMTTGNEAQLGLAEMIDFFAQDAHTGAVAVYAEQIRQAPDFLDAVRRARAQGKAVVMLHAGRSEQSQAAAQSHTGALAGNHAAMQLMAEHAGVLVVDSLEELIDLSQLMLRFPEPAAGGLGLVTASGALCGIAQDYIEPLGLEMPPLAQAQADALREHLPAYTPPRNPLDLGTEVDRKPQLIGLGVAALLADPRIGGVVVSLPMPAPQASAIWLQRFIEGTAGSRKPAILVMHNEDVAPAPAFVQAARAGGVVLLRSPERALRTLARALRFGRGQLQIGAPEQAAQPLPELPTLGEGTQAEWIGKQVLRALGIRTPEGALAGTADEAVGIAGRIGYPVVLKAQAARLAHKSEVGGVVLDLRDEAALRQGWRRLHDNLRNADVAVTLDGVLVEAMAPRGLELVVGASRDPHWGPVLMAGLGGIWVEALGDVRLLPPGLPRTAIIERLRSLKAAKLLAGFRGAPPVDLEAVADVVHALGRLMLARPDIAEVDINPLVALPRGEGAIALDALIVRSAP